MCPARGVVFLPHLMTFRLGAPATRVAPLEMWTFMLRATSPLEKPMFSSKHESYFLPPMSSSPIQYIVLLQTFF